MDTRIFLIELSPVIEDGSRKTIKETVIATCKQRGDAELILSLLKKHPSYEMLLSKKQNNERMYLLTAEQRKPMKGNNP